MNFQSDGVIKPVPKSLSVLCTTFIPFASIIYIYTLFFIKDYCCCFGRLYDLYLNVVNQKNRKQNRKMRYKMFENGVQCAKQQTTTLRTKALWSLLSIRSEVHLKFHQRCLVLKKCSSTFGMHVYIYRKGNAIYMLKGFVEYVRSSTALCLCVFFPFLSVRRYRNVVVFMLTCSNFAFNVESIWTTKQSTIKEETA